MRQQEKVSCSNSGVKKRKDTSSMIVTSGTDNGEGLEIFVFKEVFENRDVWLCTTSGVYNDTKTLIAE